MGVGIGPAFTFMQVSVGTCLPTLMMLPKLIGLKLTVVYLAFWLVYFGCEWNPRGMDFIIGFHTSRPKESPPVRSRATNTAPAVKSAAL